MPHIDLPNLPGIRAAMAYRPETAKPLNELVEVLLHDRDHTLMPGERELIAAMVSYRNGTQYCHNIHGAIAAAHLEQEHSNAEDLVAAVKQDFEAADISTKLKALLNIAAKVQVDGKLVTAEDVDRARREGATDLEIHDAVLIAAAFCMYNRYVDGLATIQPNDPELYRNRGRMVAKGGYVAANLTNRLSPAPQDPALVKTR